MEPRPYMVLELDRCLAAPGETSSRPILDEDLPALAGAMAEAYRGTVDDEGEDQPAALAELQSTAAGAYGPALRHAWLLHEVGDEPVAAVICTRWQGLPFVAYAFTHPAQQRRGLSTGLIMSAVGALRDAGESRLSLIVTRRSPARPFYQRLGFTEVPWPEGT